VSEKRECQGYLRDDVFSRFDRTPACDSQTDEQMDVHNSVSRGENADNFWQRKEKHA